MADGAAESAAAVGVEKRADVAGEEGVVSGGMVGCHLFLLFSLRKVGVRA